MSFWSRFGLGLLSFGLMVSQANAQGFGITFGGGRGVRLGRQDRIGNDGWDRRYGPARNPNPLPAAGPIELASDADTVLKYSLNTHPYEINPGQVQHLRNDRAWVIEFDRGGDLGFKTYALAAGRYKFVATPDGWDLVQSKDPIGRNPPATPPLPADRRNPLPTAVPTPSPAPELSPALATDDNLAVPAVPAPRTAPTPVDALAPTEGPTLPRPAEPTPVTAEPTPVASTRPVIPPLTKVKPRNPAPKPATLPAPSP